jgi:hypothetical protein
MKKKLLPIQKQYDYVVKIFRVKIEIEGKFIEQGSSFNYLGNLISN